MKKFKIIYEHVLLDLENPKSFDVECPVVNKQIEQGWSVVNTFRFNSSRIAFVMEKEIHDVNIQ